MTSCWVPGADASPFNVHNLPYGVFSTAEEPVPRIGVRIGDQVIDMREAVLAGDCQTCASCTALRDPALNRFLSLGRSAWRRVREQTRQMLTEPSLEGTASDWLVPVSRVRMHAPLLVTDFVGFASDAPDWRRLQPRAVNGRASTVIPSGMDLVRPFGHRRTPEGEVVFGPTAALDIGAGVGFVVGGESELGRPVGADAFEDFVFGAVLLNDWAARDFTESVAEVTSFATSMSAWVTPLEALDAARTAAPAQGPETPAYLKESDRYGFDLRLSITVNGVAVAGAALADAYWTPAQQMAQLTAGGAVLRPGMVFGSLDAPGPRWRLADGDAVGISATAPGPRGTAIALGEVDTRVTPAFG